MNVRYSLPTDLLKACEYVPGTILDANTWYKDRLGIKMKYEQNNSNRVISVHSGTAARGRTFARTAVDSDLT